MSETFYENRIDFSMQLVFTSNRRLTEDELLALHKGLQGALAQQDGPAEQLLDALREQVEDLDCDPQDWEGLGPQMMNDRPVTDQLVSKEITV